MNIVTNNVIKIVALSMLVSTLFLGGFPAQGAAACIDADVQFIFRDPYNILAKDIRWELYTQERNFDAHKYLGRRVKSGSIINEGSVNFKFNPHKIVNEAGFRGPTTYAVKVYEVNSNVGETIFWDVRIACGRNVKETFKLSLLSIVIRNELGVPLEKYPFQIFTQIRGFNNQPITDELVSSRLTTELRGKKTIHLAPGEYIIKIPVPGNRGSWYEVSGVIVRAEQQNIFDYRSGNVRVTVLGENGRPLSNARVEFYKQDFDVNGNPVLGKRESSSKTSAEGSVILFLKANIYAMLIFGPNKSQYSFYNIEVIAESNNTVTKQLSTVAVTTRNKGGSLTSGIRLSLSEQLINADGERVVGEKVQSLTSNKIGEAVFYINPGTYVLTSKDDTRFNIVVREGKTTFIHYNQSGKSNRITVLDAKNDVVVKGVVFNALPSGSLVKTAERSSVYFLEKGTLKPIPDEATFLAYNFKWNAIHTISNEKLRQYVIGLPLQPIAIERIAQGSVVKSDQASTVYRIENDTKRAFYNAYSFHALGYNFSQVKIVSTFVLDRYKNAPMIKVSVTDKENLIKANNAAVVYLIENGFKRPFENEAVFFAGGHDWDEVRIISFNEVRSYPLGAVIR